MEVSPNQQDIKSCACHRSKLQFRWLLASTQVTDMLETPKATALTNLPSEVGTELKKALWLASNIQHCQLTYNQPPHDARLGAGACLEHTSPWSVVKLACPSSFSSHWFFAFHPTMIHEPEWPNGVLKKNV